MSQLVDEAVSVRPGEELPTGRLSEFLRSELGGSGDAEISQFRGGHSNLTYLVRYDGNDYVLRRPPFGTKVRSAHDMGREYQVLSALASVWDKTPKPIARCDDAAVIGGPFYLAERLRGLIIRNELPRGVTLSPEMARGLCESLIDTLAQLHDLDFEEVGLADFGKPAGYVARQIEGWTRRYRDAATDDIESVDRVAQWLESHQPSDDDDALIHNDFKLDNLVLDPEDPTRIVGILDWEMSTVGHPLMDLGTTLCYWVEADDPAPMKMLPFGPTHLPGMMSRRELVARYQQQTGIPVEQPAFFYAFGLFKTAVVAQQIYQRFKLGHTNDPRFAQMIVGVRVLSDAALRATSETWS